METQLLIKNIHIFAVVLVFVALCVRAYTLFKGTQGNLPNPVARKAFVALQHASMTILVITGAVLLWMKHFDIQNWFYAKIILFFVILSSLRKAYSKHDNLLLVQRRAGWGIAVIAFIAILVLVMIKPNIG